MEQVLLLLKALIEDPKRFPKTLGAALLSTITLLMGWLGVQVDPKELLRPVLLSAGFYEISAAHQDSEALIKRLQDIDQKQPEHGLISQLRELSKEGRSPFQGREREIVVRFSRVAPAGDVGLVCRDSYLRDTYLQVVSPRDGLVTLKVEGADSCNHELRSQVLLNQDAWDKLVGSGATGDAKLRMNVLLHPPVEPVK
jgi:hypothetical protein